MMRRVWFRVAAGVLGAAIASEGLAQKPDGKLPPPKKVEAGKSAAIDPAPGTILQPGEYPIDLRTALDLAGAGNPELMIARQRVAEVSAVRQLAAAQLLPNLNVGTNYDLHRGA